jgi:plastocyanin
MTRSTLFAFAIVIGACGGDSNTADAPRGIDAAPSTAVMVTCPASPAATITTSDTAFAYTPSSATITQGQVVKFTMSSSHNVTPGHSPVDTAKADSGLSVTFSATKCLMFTATGTFGFHCGPHLFNGTITVQ